MIQFNNQNDWKIIQYQGHSIKAAYSNLGKVWPTDTKFSATYIGGQTYTKNCDGNTELTSATTKPSGYDYSAMTTAEIGDCVTSIGEYAFNGCSGLTSVTIPDSVTSIGYRAFGSCSSLTSVTIPSGVTSIGGLAFTNCSGLTSITINATTPPTFGRILPFGNTNDCPIYVPCESVDAYKTAWSTYASRIQCISKFKFTLNDSSVVTAQCDSTNQINQSDVSPYTSSVVSAEIGQCVTSIGYGAFGTCRSLTTCTIGSGVTIIGNSAFYYCTSLSCITIPNSVTYIGQYAFQLCSSLSSITIPSGVTSIGNGAFQNCISLTSVTCLATTPPTLGASAFTNTNNCPIYVPCQSLDAYKTAWSTYASRIQCISKFKFTLNDSSVVTAQCDSTNQISYSEVSAYTSSVVSAEIGQCVTSIGNNSFQYCSGLTSITIPSGVTSIGEDTFYNCRSLTSINIPSGVTSIGAGAFTNCSSLTSINIPSGVTSIGISSFAYCSRLELITIPSGVTSIDYNAFSGCKSLTSVTIPDNVTSIGYNAFLLCSGLTSVTVEATTPPTLGSGAFDYTNNCPIYVPSESVNAYKSAPNWNDYASRIQPIN